MNMLEQTNIDKGVVRLEREVAEIKQTTKETNTMLNSLSNTIVKIETLVVEQHKFNQSQLSHLEVESKEIWKTIEAHDNRITTIENNNLPFRVGALEGVFKWLALLIIGAIITGLLNLIII